MKRGLSLTAVLLLTFNSCTFKPAANEPRVLDVLTPRGVVKNDDKLNATYSYLVYLFHSNRGENELARKALVQTLAYDSNSTELRLQQADDLFSRGLYASAREELKEIRAKNPDAQKLYLQVLIREGNLSEARVGLDQWLLAHPKDEDFFALRAKIEIEEHNFESAKKILANFLREIPDSSQAYLLRGRINQSENKNKIALQDYKTALQLDSQNVSAAAHLAFLQDLSGQKEDATETYSWLADLTDNPEFHKRLGLLYIEQSDTRHAIAALEAYARHQPDDNQNTARLAALYMDLKDYEQAEFKLKQILAKQPDNEVIRYYYAATMYELGRKELALAEIRKVKTESKIYPERLRLELLALGETGHLDEAKILAQAKARDLLAKSNGVDENQITILYAFFASKKMKEPAKKMLEQGLKKFPKNSMLRYNQALAMDESGDWKGALALGQALLKEEPTNASVQNLVGYILASQSLDLKRAEHLIEEALKTKPDDPFMLDSKAWLLFKQNRLAEALTIIEKVNLAKPNEPIILIHLADILAKLGRLQEARAWYEKALTLGVDPVHERLRVEESVTKLTSTGDRRISCAPGALCQTN